MRKLPILLFTAVFALSLALPAYAAESSNEELKAASQYLNSHGIMVGDGEGNMNFSAPLTRAHLATILARLHGGSGQVEESRDFYAAQCQFQDVPDWARQYAGYCAYHGLMVGYGDGLFGAEDPVTPAAACTVILRYLALPDLVWDYNSACSTACDLGLSEPAMTAQGTISRGDLAVMLYRALTGNFQRTSAGATGASVSISSYKGNILEAGTRSGLLVYPSDAKLELVSSNPEILTVEQIAGNWVAVAKSPGTASIFVVTADGEQGRLTITVSDVDEGRPAAGTDYADIQGADGLSWYAMTPAAAVPEFEPETPAPSGGGLSPSAQYNAALFGQFMPGFDQPVVSVDSSRSADGILEVRHEDGTGTAFYDRTMYQAPRGDYHVFEDSGGSQWYAIPGTPAVERRPVYEDGRPVYDGDKLQTTTVETMRYKSTPSRHTQPQKRPVTERKPPNRKKP